MKGLFRFVLTLATILCLAVSAASAAALPVKALSPKQVDVNPYMAKSDANIHHDGYNTDSTDEVLPVGIYPEINVSYETTNANAPTFQFMRVGYFCMDNRDCTAEHLVFDRSVSLKDSFKK